MKILITRDNGSILDEYTVKVHEDSIHEEFEIELNEKSDPEFPYWLSRFKERLLSLHRIGM